MVIMWLKGKTTLASKRAALREEKVLKKRGWHTEIVDKISGRIKIYGVKYG
jgi:hypothetical protein